MRKWLRSADWPATFGLEPPWNVEQVKAWMEIFPKRDPAAAYRNKMRAIEAGNALGGMAPLNKAKLQNYIERALWIRQQREKDAGTLHKTDECLALHAAMVYRAKGGLLDLGRSLRNALVGQDADGIERIINERVATILQEMQAGD